MSDFNEQLRQRLNTEISDMAARIVAAECQRNNTFIKERVEDIIKQVIKSSDIEIIYNKDLTVKQVYYKPYLGYNQLRNENAALKERLQSVRDALNGVEE